jgi:flagellar hook assembly protein FlgD
MNNFLKSGDSVKVEIIDAEGKNVYTYTTDAADNFSKATGDAFATSGINGNPKDYTFVVTDATNGESIKLKLNDKYYLEEV